MSAADTGLGGPSPVSARTLIANALYEHAKWQPDEINYQLDKYAHELAEKIREAAPPARPVHAEAMGWAADLIDPEVLNSGS